MARAAILVLASLAACGATALAPIAPNSEGPIVRGHLARVRKPHPINKIPRWTWFYFDVEDGRQIIVYTNVFLSCRGVTELLGNWLTTTAVAEPGDPKAAPVTERQFFARGWTCL